MGVLTAAEIIARGQLEAGKTGLDSFALQQLNLWLQKQYASYPWPFLQKRVTGIALAAGTQSINFGNGNGGITERILRIFDPIRIYTSTFDVRNEARIQQNLDTGYNYDEAGRDPSKFTGMPVRVRVRSLPGTTLAWTLVPLPFPDRDYLMAFDYLYAPAHVVAADVPVYPGDEAMVAAVKVAVQRHANREDPSDVQRLSGYAMEDRERYGAVPGINDMQVLDGAVFR